MVPEVNVGDRIVVFNEACISPWARLKVTAIDFEDKVVTGKTLWETIDGREEPDSYWRIPFGTPFYVYHWAPEPHQQDYPHECFYKRIEAHNHFLNYLPRRHFQHPNYNQQSSLLKRAPTTGIYDIFKIGERYQLHDPSDSNKVACEGAITKIPDELCPYVHFKTIHQKELIFPVHEFYGFLKSRIWEESPALNYKEIAKNWRRFGN